MKLAFIRLLETLGIIFCFLLCWLSLIALLMLFLHVNYDSITSSLLLSFLFVAMAGRGRERERELLLHIHYMHMVTGLRHKNLDSPVLQALFCSLFQAANNLGF